MKNRIDLKFKELKKLSQKAFIAYIMAGDPNLKATEKNILMLERNGVDIVELGIPFSDPLADGPIIQAAAYRALRKKTTLRKILRMVSHIRTRTDIPIVFMSYYNPILKFGEEAFFRSCSDAGVDGLIVPDLPLEEARNSMRLAKRYGIANILLVAPTSSTKRAKDISVASSGFIYYISLTGVTGMRRRLPAEVMSSVKKIKSLSDKPVAVGFGISDAKQARHVSKIADGVIVGSAIVNAAKGGRRGNLRLSRLIQELAGAIHGS